MPELAQLRLHEDVALFREAVTYTAAQTGFVPRLIEKDYFCSVILKYLGGAAPTLLFKGGTCLAKVHFGFYRLSEDLDFMIPTPVDASRGDRSRSAAELKKALAVIHKQLPGVRVVNPLKGANNSKQYEALVSYGSITGQDESVKIEVGLREPLLTPAAHGDANTLLLNPISGEAHAPAFPVQCLSRDESMAEKLRAALSRREVAIRDFHDIDHAVQRLGFPVRDVIELVRQKLGIPGNDPVDISADRLAALRPQLEGRLRSVLRERDFAEFDLARAFAIVEEVAALLR